MWEVVVFDTETSSLDKRPEIVEMALSQYGGDGRLSFRLRPLHGMDPRAVAVHGITEADVADRPTFAQALMQVGGELPTALRLLRSARVLVGYNLDYDLRQLDAQIAEHQLPPWDRREQLVVDGYKLWQVSERRKLVDAHKRFCGGEYDGAHGALADVEATERVVEGMLQTFGLTKDWNAIDLLINPARRVSLGSKHFQWRHGRVVCAFGKHNGVDATCIDKGYLHYVIKNDFPSACKEVADRLLDGEEAFYMWAMDKYPPPADDQNEVEA